VIDLLLVLIVWMSMFGSWIGYLLIDCFVVCLILLFLISAMLVDVLFMFREIVFLILVVCVVIVVLIVFVVGFESSVNVGCVVVFVIDVILLEECIISGFGKFFFV